MKPLVLLAAGRSSRAGEPKGLVMVDGRPWIAHQLEAFASCGGVRAVVVLAHDYDAYFEALRSIAIVTIARNPDPDRGPFSSLQEGLRRVDGAAFMLPVDVPCPASEVWAALESAVDSGAAAAIPVYGGRGGHPVLLSAPIVAECMARGATDRLDAVLRGTAGVARVDVDDVRVVTNMNTPSDWSAIRR